MRAQEAFDELVDGRVWPFLLTHDFKRSRYTFHRRHGANWQVINLQKSTRSSAEIVHFTANLGVALDRLRTGGYDWAPGRRPPEFRCHMRARVGQLLSGRDTWWDLSADSNTVALGETVTLVLELYAMPWLDARSTDEALIALARDPEALRDEPGQDPLRWLSRLMGQLGEAEARRTVDAEAARRHAARSSH
ncbi:MAG: DUF4304 domain-containing protein [Gaiellales bacterium]